MGTIDLRTFGGSQPLAEAAADDCLSSASQQTPNDAPFLLALSGGRIAKTFCSALAERARSRGLGEQVHFFWSDERCVPPENPESNFLLANEALLRPLSVPAHRIHRIEGEKAAAFAFAKAEEDLRALAGLTPSGQPILQLVLLGMGEDGHVASLFPGASERDFTSAAWFRCVTASKPPPQRVTMGLPAILAAEQVWVLASGAGKRNALQESLRSGGQTPLARVIQGRTSTRIYSDIPERGA
jgi:6-phosphogluconolactonase